MTETRVTALRYEGPSGIGKSHALYLLACLVLSHSCLDVDDIALMPKIDGEWKKLTIAKRRKVGSVLFRHGSDGKPIDVVPRKQFLKLSDGKPLFLFYVPTCVRFPRFVGEMRWRNSWHLSPELPDHMQSFIDFDEFVMSMCSKLGLFPIYIFDQINHVAGKANPESIAGAENLLGDIGDVPCYAYHVPIH